MPRPDVCPSAVVLIVPKRPDVLKRSGCRAGAACHFAIRIVGEGVGLCLRVVEESDRVAERVRHVVALDACSVLRQNLSVYHGVASGCRHGSRTPNVSTEYESK